MKCCELVSLVTAISCAIAECVPREELPLVAAIIGQISTTLTTIAAQEDLLNPKEQNPPLNEAPADAALITTPPGA